MMRYALCEHSSFPFDGKKYTGQLGQEYGELATCSYIQCKQPVNSPCGAYKKCYYNSMKKIFTFLFLSILLLGCRHAVQEAADLPAESIKSVSVSVEPAAPSPTMEPEQTPLLSWTEATPLPEPSATDEPKERYYAPEGVETVAWMSDTQHYANKFPEIFPIMTGFLRDEAEKMHLVYVVHTGDLVHRNAEIENWTVAREAMDLISHIPNGVLAGNHDMEPSTGGYENYYKYFGEAWYSDMPCYGASFENNRGHYDLLTVSGRDYIFVYMSHAPDESALAFVCESFQQFPERIGILCLHDYITTEGVLSEAGWKIREKVVAKCPNLYMVLCGHRYGLYTLEDAFDDDGDGVPDRKVYEIMMNYQAAGKEGGGGYLRLMQFNEANGTISCINYSPYLHDYDWLDDPAHNEPRYEMDENSESFVLAMPWLNE